MTAFEEMGVLPEIAKAVDDMEWMLPTDVQSEAIPAILGGGDVLMAAETGSGKTGAFCLPVLQIVWETLRDIQSGKLSKGAGGRSGSKQWLMNVYDRGDAFAIAPDGLLCQSRDPQKWHGSRCTRGVVGAGKFYYEATVTDDGLCRVGWSTLNASHDVGTDTLSFGFGGTGKKSFNKSFEPYGESFSLKDTIGCYLDLDNAQIAFSKNGVIFPTAFEIPSQLHNSPLFASVVLKNAELLFNFGSSPFKFPPKNAFVGLTSAAADNVVSSDISGSSAATSSLKAAPNAPMCIIIEPSRELAQQTFNQVDKFRAHMTAPQIRNALVVGGVPARDQLRELERGVDIVTGTPGRLDEFISTGQLCLSQVRFFILDEADGLLSAGHGDLINRVHGLIPKVTPDGRRLQMVVCSATLHNFDIKKMAERLMHFPQWVDLKGQDAVPDTVHHVVVVADPRTNKRWINLKQRVATDGIHSRDEIRPGRNDAETLSQAVKLLKGELVLQAIRQHKMDQCLVFCRTKLDCDNLERYLKAVSPQEFSCVCLHGDRRPAERQQNLQLFKDGEVGFLICTDVAARGIDITGIPYVINVTLPDEKANYLHRIGRVGRAERMGLAISLVSAVPEKVWYHQCPSRGKSCNNTRLTDQGGCSIWYNEPQLLADIEEHLGVTIQQVESGVCVPVDEFDGKVTYGAKRGGQGSGYEGHASVLADAVSQLAQLERQVQTSYLRLKTRKLA